MKASIKIMRPLLESVRQDLHRSHPSAHERVGFLLGTTSVTTTGLLVTVVGYHVVADEDYERNDRVGASIGPDAMRKAVQSAYRPPRALLHVHCHGGTGRPGFSGVDLKSGYEFVPGLMNPIPKMPHGMLVLNKDSAYGLFWYRTGAAPAEVTNFVTVGQPYARNWGSL